MSTSKHIDKICLAVCLFSLLLTGLFMNGKALGLTPAAGGDAGRGELPEMPGGDAKPGEIPEMQGGQTPDADHMPDIPVSGDMDAAPAPDGPSMPDNNPGMQDGMGGGRFGQWEQNRDGPQDAAAAGISTISPSALALVGASALCLLAGILVALKVKH